MPDPLSILLSPQTLISSEENTLCSASNNSVATQGTGVTNCVCTNCEMDKNAPQPTKAFAQDKPCNVISNQQCRQEGELRRVPAQILLNRQSCDQQSEKNRESCRSCDQQSVKNAGNYQPYNQYNAKNAGNYQSFDQNNAKNIGNYQSFDPQSEKNRGKYEPLDQQNERNRGNYQPFNQTNAKYAGSYQLLDQQSEKNRGNFQSFDQQSVKNRGDYQTFDQQSERNRGNNQPSNQQNTKNRGSFQSFDQQKEKNRGDYQPFNQQSENKKGNCQPFQWSDKNRGGYSCKNEETRESTQQSCEEQRNYTSHRPQNFQCEGQCQNADLGKHQKGTVQAGGHGECSQSSLKRKYSVNSGGQVLTQQSMASGEVPSNHRPEEERKTVSPAYVQQKQGCGQKTFCLGPTASQNSLELGKNNNSCCCDITQAPCDGSCTLDKSQVMRPCVQSNETNVNTKMNSQDNSQLKYPPIATPWLHENKTRGNNGRMFPQNNENGCKFDGTNNAIGQNSRLYTQETENRSQSSKNNELRGKYIGNCLPNNENKWPSVFNCPHNTDSANYFSDHNMPCDNYLISRNRSKAHERNNSCTTIRSGQSCQHNIHSKCETRNNGSQMEGGKENQQKAQKRPLDRTESDYDCTCSCTSVAKHSLRRARSLRHGRCGKMYKK